MRRPTPSRNGQELRVLLAEDRDDDAALLVLNLEQAGYRIVWHRVDTEEAFRAALDQPWDVILADYNLPQLDFFRGLRLARTRAPELPVILVSGHITEEAAVRAIQEGVDDYVLKDRPARLATAVRQVLERRRMQHERHRALRALQISERRYRNISELSSDFSYEYKLMPGGKLVLLWVTDAFTTITGYTPDEMVARGGWITLVHPEDTRYVREHISALLQGQASTTECRLLTRSGAVRWVRDVSRPIWNAEKTAIASIIGAVGDITERKMAEHRNEHLAAIVASTNVAVVGTSLDGTVLSWNKAAEDVYGYCAEEVVGRSVAQIFPEQSRVPLAAILQQISEGVPLIPFEAKRVCKDGRVIDVSVAISPVHDVNGEVIGASAISRDITALKHAQDEAQRLATAVRRTTNGVIITDTQGRIDWVNEGFTRVTGYTLEEVKGKKPGSVLQGPETDQETVAHVRAQLQKEEGFKVEILNYRKSGEPYWVRVDVEPLRDEQGGLAGYMSIETDITQSKERERELRRAKEQAEEMERLKTTLLTNMSHEVRTPLNGIIGFAEILAENTSGENLEFAQLILQSGERLLNTLNAVLDLAQLESRSFHLNPSRFDLRAVLNETLSGFRKQAQEKDVALDFDGSASETIMLQADKAALARVLYNLISNAIKFTPRGKVVVSLRDAGNEAVISVADTGLGIAPAFRPHLFQPFRQSSSGLSRDHEGLGIGLAVVKKLLDLMGGTITVESRPGEGSVFTVRLPGLEDAPQPSPEPPQPSPEPVPTEAMGRQRILVVEDNEINREIMLRILNLEYAAETAQGVDEALEKAMTMPFDAFVLDINLGERRTGIEVMHMLRDMPGYERTPMIACTAYSLPGSEARFLQAGFTAFLAKPFTMNQLQEVVEQAFKAKPVPEQPMESPPDLAIHLPPPSDTLSEVAQMLADADAPDLKRLVAVLRRDPIASSWVLKHVNSAFYGLQQKVSSIDRAVMLLGFEPVCNLVLMGVLSNTLVNISKPEARHVYTYLIQTSVATAVFAERLAQALAYKQAGVIFSSALLHQVGRLALLAEHSAAYVQLWFEGAPGGEAVLSEPPRGQELLALQTDYIHVGAMVSKAWGLPEAVEAVIRYHAQPLTAPVSWRPDALLINLSREGARRVWHGKADTLVAMDHDPGHRRRIEALATLHRIRADDVLGILEASTSEVRRFMKMSTSA